jgi:hypothetical protein
LIRCAILFKECQISKRFWCPDGGGNSGLDPAEIDLWFYRLVVPIEGLAHQFVGNIDEIGCSDSSDAHEVKVIVRDKYPEYTIPVPVNCHSKRASLIAYIAGDDSCMNPFIILERSMNETEIIRDEYSLSSIVMVPQENAHMTPHLFKRWAGEVLFPKPDHRRFDLRSTGKEVSLMNGFAAHHMDSPLDKCQEKRVDIVFFVSHSSDLCSLRDLLVFSLLK